MREQTLEKKIQKMIETVREIKPGVFNIEVIHSPDCPSIITQSLSDCTCEPDFKVLKKIYNS